MSNPVTTEIDRLKAAHREAWDSGDYAAVARDLVQEVAETAVAAVRPRDGERILDIATGSGNAAIGAARAGAEVTGVDLAPTLIAVARERAEAAGVSVEWLVGDAEQLPFADASFDKVVSVLGVQFTPRHERSARELARVVRPGGEVVLCNWTPAGYIGQFFKTIGPRLPKPPEGVAPPPLWGDEDHVRELFAGSDLELTFKRYTVMFRDASPSAFVDYMAANYGPLLKARERLQPTGGWDALRGDLVALSESRNLGGHGFLVASEYLLVHGRRGAR